ncbi:hypothetical protein [Flavobacterium sp.]
MNAEVVYNIAIHLSPLEMNRLCALLTKRQKSTSKTSDKKVKAKLITEAEAREYVLRVVFGMKEF